jgi:hypothetical protein
MTYQDWIREERKVKKYISREDVWNACMRHGVDHSNCISKIDVIRLTEILSTSYRIDDTPRFSKAIIELRRLCGSY